MEPSSFREEGGEARYNPNPAPPIPAADEWGEEKFLQAARATAYRCQLPEDAADVYPLGYYAHWLTKYQQAWGHREADEPKSTRDFVSRISHDAVVLKNVMACMLGPKWHELSKLIPKNENPHFYIMKAQALAGCLETKPDPRFLGYKYLPKERFKRSFDGDNPTFFHHLCEGRHGEAIMMDSTAERLAVKQPFAIAMHHPQFYTEAHKNEAQRISSEKAKAYWALKRKSRNGRVSHADTQEFLQFMALRDNSGYKPIGRDECVPMTVAFHTLPSLVWECCHESNLLEIYTYFCSQPLFLAAASHSTGGSGHKQRKREQTTLTP